MSVFSIRKARNGKFMVFCRGDKTPVTAGMTYPQCQYFIWQREKWSSDGMDRIPPAETQRSMAETPLFDRDTTGRLI